MRDLLTTAFERLPLGRRAMLSPHEIARIEAEIETLEKAREHCADSGLQKLIDAWINEQKKKLEQR
jgi:hypothetical protein